MNEKDKEIIEEIQRKSQSEDAHLTINGLDYENILRQIEKLKTGVDGGRGTMDGLAEATYWRIITEPPSNSIVSESLQWVLSGIMKSLDILREKVEEIEMKVKSLIPY